MARAGTMTGGMVHLDLVERIDRRVLRWATRRGRCASCLRRCEPRHIIVHTLGVHFHHACYRKATRDELENISKLMEAYDA